MRYEITIKRIETKTITRRGDHTVIGEAPWTEDEVASEKAYAQTQDEFLKKNPTKKLYGYAPNYQTTTEETTEVLKQVVDDMDLPTVIKAVNKL